MPGTESEFEETTLERLRALGYTVAYGPDIVREPHQVVLADKLQNFLCARYPDEAAEYALRVFTRPEGVTPELRNKKFIADITRGIEAPYKDENGNDRHVHVYPIDWEDPEANDFLAVNQFEITGKITRRPDIILSVNGLPLVLFELKNPYDEQPTIEGAYNQLQHYRADIPQLFEFNAFGVISDCNKTMHGVPESGFEFWAEWKSITGTDIEPGSTSTMKTLIQGLFPRERLLRYIRSFLVFETVNEKVIKKAAKYHQYFVVMRAAELAVESFRPGADPRIGVIWHTQGAGKSLEMVFLVGILRKLLNNPTFVIQVDRNALDEQLYKAFVAARELVGEVKQAESIEELRTLLRSDSGEIIFSTIQKFSLKDDEAVHPVLTERSDIIVIADEAHRTQYGLIGGLANNLRRAIPNAKYLGFTGTPIDFTNADTRAVFGEFIQPIYDMPQSEEDKSTVPIYYEARLAALHLTNPQLDEELEDILSEQDEEEIERRKPQWAAIERAAGASDRVRDIAKDLLSHFDKRQGQMEGKAMAVCMSRANCVKLYDAIVALRPEWADPDLHKGAIKVVMTHRPDKDPTEWNAAGHITGSAQRSLLGDRFKDPDDPLRIVIVCDMWLTGFDVPILNTMYIDKPMKGHNLMQAIARANRVFKDKPGGVIVDYIGIAEYLKDATSKYTASGGRGKPAPPIEDDAFEVFLQHVDAVRTLVPEDCTNVDNLGLVEREDLHCLVLDYLLATNDRRDQFLVAENKLSAAASLVMHLARASQYAGEVGFYQGLRAGIRKTLPLAEQKQDIERAVRALVDNSIESQGVVDLFAKAGIENPDVSIIDERFLQEFATKEYPNLRVRLLEKLMKDEIKLMERKNPVRARSLLQMLEETLERYHNNLLSTAQLIQEMIKMRKEMQSEAVEKNEYGLEDEELAFFDALVLTEGHLYEHPFLAELVRDIVKSVKKNLKPDWLKSHRENIQAEIRSAVRRVLLAKGVKAEDFDLIIARVMEQAKAIYGSWPSMPIAGH